MAGNTARLKETGKHTGSLVVETLKEWLADKATTYAGDLSYRIVLALSPLVVIAAGIVGLIYQDEDALENLLARTEGYLGEASVDALKVVLDNMTAPGASFWAIFIGSIILIYTAGGAFRALRKSLNAIWNVEMAPLKASAGRLATFALNQLLLLGLVLLLGLMLAALLALSAGWSWLTAQLTDYLPADDLVTRAAGFVLTLGVTTAVFAGVFSIVPQGRLPHKYVWVSGLVTAVLFYIGRLGFGIYIDYSSRASAYGAAGTLIVFLIWVYYSSMIVFFGAELAQVWARRRGDRVVPRKGAIMAAGFDGVRPAEARPESPEDGQQDSAADPDDTAEQRRHVSDGSQDGVETDPDESVGEGRGDASDAAR